MCPFTVLCATARLPESQPGSGRHRPACHGACAAPRPRPSPWWVISEEAEIRHGRLPRPCARVSRPVFTSQHRSVSADAFFLPLFLGRFPGMPVSFPLCPLVVLTESSATGSCVFVSRDASPLWFLCGRSRCDFLPVSRLTPPSAWFLSGPTTSASLTPSPSPRNGFSPYGASVNTRGSAAVTAWAPLRLTLTPAQPCPPRPHVSPALPGSQPSSSRPPPCGDREPSLPGWRPSLPGDQCLDCFPYCDPPFSLGEEGDWSPSLPLLEADVPDEMELKKKSHRGT